MTFCENQYKYNNRGISAYELKTKSYLWRTRIRDECQLLFTKLLADHCMVMGHCDVKSFLAPPPVAPLHVEICIRAYTDVVSMLSTVFHWNAMQICRLLSVHVICPYTRQRAFYGIKRAIFFENELFRFRLRDRKTRDKNSRIIVVQRTYSIIICRVVRLYAWFNPNKRNALPVWLHVTNADPIPTSDRISFF